MRSNFHFESESARDGEPSVAPASAVPAHAELGHGDLGVDQLRALVGRGNSQGRQLVAQLLKVASCIACGAMAFFLGQDVSIAGLLGAYLALVALLIVAVVYSKNKGVRVATRQKPLDEAALPEGGTSKTDWATTLLPILSINLVMFLNVFIDTYPVWLSILCGVLVAGALWWSWNRWEAPLALQSLDAQRAVDETDVGELGVNDLSVNELLVLASLVESDAVEGVIRKEAREPVARARSGLADAAWGKSIAALEEEGLVKRFSEYSSSGRRDVHWLMASPRGVDAHRAGLSRLGIG